MSTDPAELGFIYADDLSGDEARPHRASVPSLARLVPVC